MLWRKFQIWRAIRIYKYVDRERDRLRRLVMKADRLISGNSEPPQMSFDWAREQEMWSRGK
jgi:hypothetical protein